MKLTPSEWARIPDDYKSESRDGTRRFLRLDPATGATVLERVELVDHLGRNLDCEVCGKDISKDRGRCTNGRCAACHANHCTPGGDTSPGHGRRWPATGATP